MHRNAKVATTTASFFVNSPKIGTYISPLSKVAFMVPKKLLLELYFGVGIVCFDTCDLCVTQ